MEAAPARMPEFVKWLHATLLSGRFAVRPCDVLGQAGIIKRSHERPRTDGVTQKAKSLCHFAKAI